MVPGLSGGGVQLGGSVSVSYTHLDVYKSQGYSSSCAMATASVFDENGMILMGVAASHADLPNMGEYVFPIPMSQRLEALEFANATEQLCGIGNVAILYQNTDHGVQASQLFKEQWDSLVGLGDEFLYLSLIHSSACSSSGGSTPPSLTLCNGPEGSGGAAWDGIR